jgi:hypothetical protein
MKNKLYIVGLVSLSLLTYSCSNEDDSYDVQEVKNNKLEITPQSALKVRVIDSTIVKLDLQISTMEGDPSVGKPPRQN